MWLSLASAEVLSISALRRPSAVSTGATPDREVTSGPEVSLWVIPDLIGKGKHIRTVPVPVWAKRAVDVWITAAGICDGVIFRRVSRLGKIWGDGITPKAIWHAVKAAAKRAGIKDLAPHDLRRTCARLCHLAGGEIEQIQFLLGTHRFRQPSAIWDASRSSAKL